MPATTRFTDPRLPDPPVLYLAFELSKRSWKLAFSTGFGQKPRIRPIPASDLDGLSAEIEAARSRFRLPDSTPLLSCYEAGRDGFWLHRFLSAGPGTVNLVVDSSSIEVKRRKRRLKTDRVDARKLLSMLIRYHNGERRAWSVVHVPSPEAEDARHLHRELGTLKRDRTRVTNRIKGLLASQGLSIPLGTGFLRRLEDARLWDEYPLYPFLHARLAREWHAREQLGKRIRSLEDRQRALLASAADPALERPLCQIRQLMTLKGIGLQSAWLFTFEIFAWRQIQNRRELAAICGFTPTPFQSGDESHEQGISKAGHAAIRAMAIQIAWGWLRFQPASALTRWYEERFANQGRRARAVGIVALARKLLIELWTFLETGALPEGAVTMT